jgi:hypothetical protein
LAGAGTAQLCINFFGVDFFFSFLLVYFRQFDQNLIQSWNNKPHVNSIPPPHFFPMVRLPIFLGHLQNKRSDPAIRQGSHQNRSDRGAPALLKLFTSPSVFSANSTIKEHFSKTNPALPWLLAHIKCYSQTCKLGEILKPYWQ